MLGEIIEVNYGYVVYCWLERRASLRLGELLGRWGRLTVQVDRQPVDTTALEVQRELHRARWIWGRAAPLPAVAARFGGTLAQLHDINDYL
eukprot:COSAG01_NODE_45640_length_407_cov_1.905844_1_plen_90_part_01